MLTEKEILEMQELIKESKRSYDYDLESPPFSHYYAEIVEKALKENNELRKQIKALVNNLKLEYEQLTQSVKIYEEMRRNCKDEFYLKSYQTTIHRLNAKRETISNIIEILEGKENANITN